MIRFTSASVSMNDSGEPEYTPKRQICVRASSIDWFYDHKLCIGDQKIPVMEDFEEIRKKVRESGELCG